MSKSLRRGILLSEIILATTLVLLFLGDKSLWLDEALSITIVRDWASIWPVMLRYNANMWLYYTLLYFWLNLGESEFALRSLSAIFAIATVPVIYVLGTRLFGSRVGILAGLLLAMNAFYIHYAQEARSYSLLVFLTTLASYFFVRGVERTSWKHWGGYAITIALAMYAHYFGALVLVAHITSLVIPRKGKIPWKGLAISGVATVLLLLPLALFQPLGIGQPTWVQQPEVYHIGRLFVSLAGRSFALLLVYFSLCFVAVGFAVARFRDKSSLKIWGYAFLITWLSVPIVIAFVTSLLLRPVFVDRYLIICLPPFILLTATGLSSISRRRIFAAILTILLILSGWGLFTWYIDYQKENWRDATAFVLTEALPDEVVYFYVGKAPFEYYLGRFNVSSDFLNLRGPNDLADLEVLDSLSDEHARVWLVLSHDQISRLERDVKSRLIQSSLERHYTLTQEQKFKGIRVLLYQRMSLDPKQ